MVLKFGGDDFEPQNIMTCRSRKSDGTERLYTVWLDDKQIGTTYGHHDHAIVINLFGYGYYIFDYEELMYRMMKSMTMSDLLAIGKKC